MQNLWKFVVFMKLLLAIQFHCVISKIHSKCPDEKTYTCERFGDKLYFINGYGAENWYQAQRKCRQIDADLVTIESANELQALDKILTETKHANAPFYWIGLNKLASNNKIYSIATGEEAPYLRFSKGEPNNAGGIEHCLEIRHSDGWYGMNDNYCGILLHYICEYDI